MDNRKLCASGIACILVTGGSLFSASCSRHNSEGKEESAAVMVHAPEFHADDDIAMTVRSLTDALSVGERLDSNYNLSARLLTDGIGRPLYASLDGRPGLWDVTATSDTSIVISNRQIGDLDVEALKEYLLGAQSDKAATDYDVGGNVEYRFNTRIDTAENGLTGAMLTLTILSTSRKQ